MDFIVRQKNFWIDEDDAVLRAIHEGFVQTHQAMWKELGKREIQHRSCSYLRCLQYPCGDVTTRHFRVTDLRNPSFTPSLLSHVVSSSSASVEPVSAFFLSASPSSPLPRPSPPPETWPKTASGLPSTAGTTASVAFIRRGKIYIGHVGDSAIVLGVQDPVDRDSWICQPLTRDHKPESQEESKRIQVRKGVLHALTLTVGAATDLYS